MYGKKAKQDISDLLNEADAENEIARAKREKPVADKKLTKTIVVPPVSHQAQPKPKERMLDAETIELIDKYSTREIRDTKSDTGELRETLSRRLKEDSLFGGYMDHTRTNAPKAENLRTLIRASEHMSADEMERSATATDPSGRFTEEEDLPHLPEFEQEQMFPMGEHLPAHAQKKRFSDTFDHDYEQLGEKVIEQGFTATTELDEKQLSFLPEETDVAPISPEMDEKERQLRMAFDLMEEDGDADFVPVGPVKKKKKQKELLLRYTDRSQNAELVGKLKKEVFYARVRLVMVVLCTLLLGYFELFGAKGGLSFLLSRGKTGIRLFLTVDLQLLFFCALAILPLTVRGVRSLFRRKLIPESLLVFGLAFGTLYSVSQLIALPAPADIRMHHLTMAFVCVSAAVADLLTCTRNLYSFKIIASKQPKYIAKRLENAVKESEEFSRHLYENSEMYTVRRTDFVEGFSERVMKRPKYYDVFHFLIPLLAVAAIALFGTLLVMGRSVEEAIRASSVLIAFSVPTSAFFLISLPLTAATRQAKKCSGAFIGNGIAEEYSMAAALTFADTEAYPSNMVNVTSVKTYGDYRIDKVIPEVARIFSYLGGPLSKVTERMVDEPVIRPRSARVIENVSDGICVAVDGKHVFLGKRSYLRRYRFSAPIDQGDEKYEKNTGSIMYVVIDEQLAAKFYIRYRINPRFEQLLKDLYRANLCLGIKTMDPNITSEMIQGAIRFHKCPIAVLKQDAPQDISGSIHRSSGGVVCNSSLHNFLKMFSLCDKVRHVTRCNAIISSVSVVLSAITVGFLAVTGHLNEFDALRSVLFQLGWQLPIWLISLLGV